MNNPVRAMLQRHFEARLLERLGGRVEGLRVLEIGCGRGVGAEIILERFGAREVHSFDLDPTMVELARRRLAAYLPDRLRLFVGDATAIDAENAAYDAVFDFGALHHVPDWQAAVAEVRRVLRPGGRFFFEEVTRRALDRQLYRVFLEHPTENRFSSAEFVAELRRQRIQTEASLMELMGGDYIVGVGRREGDARPGFWDLPLV